MPSTTSKWLIGCGIGCGVIILLIAAMIGGSYFLMRDTMKGFKESSQSDKLLDEKYGASDGFTPWPDGAVPPARMDVFLSVREATQPSREQIVKAFSGLPTDKAQIEKLKSQSAMEKISSVFKIGKSAFGLGSTLGTFFQVRNDAMLSAEMGMGEYTYIYAIAYYGGMKHSAWDGPEGPGGPNGDDGAEHGDQGSAPPANRRVRHHTSELRAHDDLMKMLSNQLASLPAGAIAGAPADWRQVLAREIAALEDDSTRMPWKEGLPPQIAASLEAYRPRLEATYTPVTNEFELGRSRAHGNWSVTAE
jgi:hypothetical protein